MEILYIGRMRGSIKPYSIILNDNWYLNGYFCSKSARHNILEDTYNFNIRFENSCLVVKKTNNSIPAKTKMLRNYIWGNPSIYKLMPELNADSIFQFPNGEGVFIIVLCRLNDQEIFELGEYYYDSGRQEEYCLKFL